MKHSGRFEPVKIGVGKEEKNQQMVGRTVGRESDNCFQVVHQYDSARFGNAETYIGVVGG